MASGGVSRTAGQRGKGRKEGADLAGCRGRDDEGWAGWPERGFLLTLRKQVPKPQGQNPGKILTELGSWCLFRGCPLLLVMCPLGSVPSSQKGV